MVNDQRPRRPYEKKTGSKRGALIFGLGLGAVLLTLVLVLGPMTPYLGDHLDNLSYRARTYYRKLVPHPEYLPTPDPVAANMISPEQTESDQLEIIPALRSNAISTAEVAEDNAASPLATPTAAVAWPDEGEDFAEEGGVAEANGENEKVEEENLLASSPPEEEIAEFGAEAEKNERGPALAETEAALSPTGRSVQLTGFTHQWQTWNNCGPATITTYMSYFGRSEDQAEAALFLKPNRDDKNVTPDELVAYARRHDLAAITRQGGSLIQLKRFLSNELPVLVETWLVHEGDGLGHYRLITGFDEATGQFTTADSLNGPAYTVGYDQLDADWRVFNRLYVVVYPPEQAPTVAAIIGPDLDETVMYERLLAAAQADIEANPEDAVAYFNQGEVLTRLERFEEAVAAFDQARRLGLHWRRLWYQFAPFEAYYAVGRYQDVLDLTGATIKGAGGLEEAYYYHGLALRASDQAGAAENFEAALEYNPNFTPAAEALPGEQ